MPRVRILLIEDDENDAVLIQRELKKLNGYQMEIKTVKTMKEVIVDLNTSPWDMIICDFRLPAFDAFAVIQFIDENELDVPFILVSGILNDELVDQAISLGAHEYLPKDQLHRLSTIVNRELKISNAYDETLKAFVRALAFRDYESADHSERVVNLTQQLARKMGISEISLIHISRGALLHDIGKLGIPDSLLLKKGKLTYDEMERMKMHTLIGRDLLARIPFLRRAIEIPHYHHERWDGSGYPYGISGHNIPLSARIFAVIDCYDAMVTNRPYRDALSKEFVLKYLNEQSGILFDPRVIHHFLSLMEAPNGS